VRISEPYFFFELKEEIKRIFCCCRSKEADEETDNECLIVRDFNESTVSSIDKSGSQLSSELKEQARISEKLQKKSEMAPLFLFLASSFNVELVYMILKGITQFSYTTCDNGKCSITTAKR
jgi:hypothetical protein